MPRKKREKYDLGQEVTGAVDYLDGIESGAWESKYRVGLMVSTVEPSPEGKLQVHRENMGHGKHSVVVSTSEGEAQDILARQREDVADNRKKHGYWEPEVQDGAMDYGGGKVKDARDE